MKTCRTPMFYMQPLGERRPSQQGPEEHEKEEVACEAWDRKPAGAEENPRME